MNNTATNLYIFRLFGQINFSFKEMKLCSARTSKVSLVNYFIFAHLCGIIEFLFIVLGAREIRIEVQISPGFSKKTYSATGKQRRASSLIKKESTSGFTVNSQRQIIKYS